LHIRKSLAGQGAPVKQKIKVKLKLNQILYSEPRPGYVE
jgi:hypothetical protein